MRKRTATLLTLAAALPAILALCSSTGGSSPTTACGISITPTNLDLAVGSGGFGGTAFAIGGGTISNVAQ